MLCPAFYDLVASKVLSSSLLTIFYRLITTPSKRRVARKRVDGGSRHALTYARLAPAGRHPRVAVGLGKGTACGRLPSGRGNEQGEVVRPLVEGGPGPFELAQS